MIFSTTSWENFPWKKIHLRLIVIQKKICQAAKRYRKYELYKLQKYLLNSNELKVISIDYMTRAIEEQYKYNYNKLLSINCKQKNIILKMLYFPYLSISHRINFILEKIKQYMIFSCMKPEWEAKMDLMNYNNINRLISQYSIFRFDYFLNKFQHYKYINLSMSSWIKSYDFINNICMLLIYQDKLYYKIIYPYKSIFLLYILLLNIFFIGYNWYNFLYKNYTNCSSVTHFFFNKNTKNQLSYLRSTYGLSQLIDEIKFFIRSKQDSPTKLENKLGPYFKYLYNHNLSFLSILEAKFIYFIINRSLYYSIIKKTGYFIYTKLLYIQNQSINLYLHVLRYRTFYCYKYMDQAIFY